MGYKYQVISDGNGGQTDTCSMPNGVVCSAWDFLEGKCGQAYSYCAKQGLGIRTAADGKNPYSREYAVCVDATGTDIGSVTVLNDLAPKLLNHCSANSEPSSAPPSTLPNVTSGSAKSTEIDPYIQRLAGMGTTPPSSWDWRSATYDGINGNWTSPVKDQGNCGSCWAFAAVGVAESSINISNDNPALDVDLAEEYLVSDCETYGGYQNCCGGWGQEALRFIRDTGIPDESCMSYVDGGSTGCGCDNGCNINSSLYSNTCTYHGTGQCSDTTCSNRCSDYASRLQNITATGYVGSDPTTIKQALVTYGPLLTSIYINPDRAYFDGDIVRCNGEDGDADHVVDIVGYDDSGGYWIAKNSWGSTWNGNGFFKLGYGECEAESYVYYAYKSPTFHANSQVFLPLVMR